jgi:RHS repeat-associated protein
MSPTLYALNGTSTQYLYDGLDTVREVVGGTPANYLRSLAVDEALVRNGSEFYLSDALGSTIELTDSGGAVATEYSYEAFGLTSMTGIPSGNKFAFTGREEDGTGLNYYRARYHHPTFQRFISEDSLGFIDAGNLYMYVLNNPTSLVDPLGLYWEYHQRSGALYFVDNQTADRQFVYYGYSGFGPGFNNPALQYRINTGPIPQGTYDIGRPRNSVRTGRYVLDLTPRSPADLRGRTDFQFHGDNSMNNRTASRGCIVVPLSIRQVITASGDSTLVVIP